MYIKGPLYNDLVERMIADLDGIYAVVISRKISREETISCRRMINSGGFPLFLRFVCPPTLSLSLSRLPSRGLPIPVSS